MTNAELMLQTNETSFRRIYIAQHDYERIVQSPWKEEDYANAVHIINVDDDSNQLP